MANNAVWQIFHVLCFVAHIGMFIAGVAVFILGSVNEEAQWDQTDSDPSTASQAVWPWIVAAVGVAGIAINGPVFKYLKKATRHSDQGTENDKYFKIKNALMISLIAQSFLTTADIVVGGVVGGKASEGPALAAPCAVAIVAGILSLATGITDISQLNYYREENKGVESGSFELSHG